MKKHYEPSVVLLEMNEAITLSQEQDLPLTAIELTHIEWANFKKALMATPGWDATIDELDSKRIMYRGIKIFEESP